ERMQLDYRAARRLQVCWGLICIGYVVGDGVYWGEAGVVVWAGVTGNDLLKVSEGLATMIAARIEALFQRNLLSRADGALALLLLNRLQTDLAPARHNGSRLLGLQGVVVKSHGSASVSGFPGSFHRAVVESCEPRLERVHGRIGAMSHHS
ncbi:phosphate acyltransferase, partial [Pseudomonas syringae]